jgi:predicted amidohydrolase YtcJ
MQATLVIRNATICTFDPARPWAGALAVAGERIVWTGDDADATEWVGPGAQTIDAGGGLLLPGFCDSHFHLLLGARTLAQARPEGAASLLRAYAAAHPDRPWIVGRGWTYRLFADGATIDRRLLDAVVPDRPVLLSAFDGHTAWANTAALRLAGILEGADTGTPFGAVVMGDDGRATGELREAPAINAELGRLAPGYLADCVLLDRDVFALAPEALGEVRVDLTGRNLPAPRRSEPCAGLAPRPFLAGRSRGKSGFPITPCRQG